MKRIIFSIATLILAVVAVVAATKQGDTQGDSGGPGWEYLVVAGGNVNLDAGSSGGRMRKETAGFTREHYPLELNLDKLGAKGWELVQVIGNPADPTFVFKRRK
jgi:hypothetical protein